VAVGGQRGGGDEEHLLGGDPALQVIVDVVEDLRHLCVTP
jgi:hypothetical protein